jgi:hypothetical protein
MATIIAQARKLSAFFSWCEDFAKSIICERQSQQQSL